MGKKKLESISKIKDKNSRNVTYCKRKRGLIKKAIELSMLCDQSIYLAIFDKEKQRFIQYYSSDSFNVRSAFKLNQDKYKQYLRTETYTNQNYSFFEKNTNNFESQTYQNELVKTTQDVLETANNDMSDHQSELSDIEAMDELLPAQQLSKRGFKLHQKLLDH